MKPLILASTSPYRAELLHKLGIPFQCVKPDFDEDAKKDDLLKKQATPLEIAEALSRGKARSILRDDAVVVAGDQLVDFNSEILGKSYEFKKAKLQLQAMRGTKHTLITAVTIKTSDGEHHLNHLTTLTMRNLSDIEIENYLNKDEPYDCAGSYKIEKSGLLLFSQIETDDFSAIQGLPLMWIAEKLKELGYEFFTN